MDIPRALRVHAWLPVLLPVLIVAAVLSARQPDKVLHPQFWAEDAALFFVDAEMFGASAIRLPYAGYWHLIPRLVASSVRSLPVLYLPAVYSLAAFLITAATVVYVVRSDLARTGRGAAGMAAALLLAPFSGEIWYVLTNVQWVTALVPVVALATAPPRERSRRVAVIAAVLLAGLTGPFTLLFLPLAGVRVWFRRERWSWILAASMLLCAALTLLPSLQHPRSHVELPWQRAWALLQHAPERWTLSTAVVAAVAVLACAAIRGARSADLPLLVTAGSGAIVVAALVFTLPLPYLGALPEAGGRYLLLPWTLTAWALILLSERRYLAWTSVPLLVCALVSVAAFRLPPRDVHDWTRDAECLETQWKCRLTVPPGWTFVLPGRLQTRRHP